MRQQKFEAALQAILKRVAEYRDAPVVSVLREAHDALTALQDIEKLAEEALRRDN